MKVKKKEKIYEFSVQNVFTGYISTRTRLKLSTAQNTDVKSKLFIEGLIATMSPFFLYSFYLNTTFIILFLGVIQRREELN